MSPLQAWSTSRDSTYESVPSIEACVHQMVLDIIALSLRFRGWDAIAVAMKLSAEFVIECLLTLLTGRSRSGVTSTIRDIN